MSEKKRTIAREPRESNRPLTKQQLDFIAAYIETGNGCESLRRAYPKAAKWKSIAQRVRASELLDDPRIEKAIAAHRAKAARNTVVTLEELIDECNEARDIARAEQNAPALVAAVQLKARLAGKLTDKVQQEVTMVGPADLKPDLSNLRRAAVAAAAESTDNSGPEAQSPSAIH